MGASAKGPLVSISATRHKELLEAERILDALRAYGVDNWPGYDEAIQAIYGDPDAPNDEDS